MSNKTLDPIQEAQYELFMKSEKVRQGERKAKLDKTYKRFYPDRELGEKNERRLGISSSG